MPRTVPFRLTVVGSALAATAAVGVLLAPAAAADPGRCTVLPAHLYSSSTPSKAPGVVANVPPFGRKIS